MTRKPDLSRGEFEIMDVLWELGHASVREVQAALEPERKLSRNCIATVLTRMKAKGYVDAQEKSFAWDFRPLIKREEVIGVKLDDLVNRLLGGEVLPLLSYAAESGKLTTEQANALAKIAKSDRG